MSYAVHVEVINPYGICLGDELTRVRFNPFASLSINLYDHTFLFRNYQGIGNLYDFYWSHFWRMDIDTLITDYFTQTYNITDTRRSFLWSSVFRSVSTRSENHQRNFHTKAEALEYVDTLGNPEPIVAISNGDNVFTATWEEQIDGIWIERSGALEYTGDGVTLYTINDLRDFLVLFFGVTSEEIPIEDGVTTYEETLGDDARPVPEINCEPYLKATIIDIDGPDEAVEINIDFDGSSVPGDVIVTVIDGDPPATELENGAGSITISDNGNILMLNDGGTFFLNEFGNVGFYANGDASLTADSQVQLGVGQNSVTVENGSLTIRDSSGSATLTAAELNSLKDLLS